MVRSQLNECSKLSLILDMGVEGADTLPLG